MKKATDSSMFTDVEYRPETKELILTWRKDGKPTTYYDVPEEIGVNCYNAESVGKFYNTEIKNKFESDISRAAQAESAPPIEQPIPETSRFGDLPENIEDDDDEDF